MRRCCHLGYLMRNGLSLFGICRVRESSYVFPVMKVQIQRAFGGDRTGFLKCREYFFQFAAAFGLGLFEYRADAFAIACAVGDVGVGQH